MDMDRTDYLRRDSLHCGVEYGVFDFQRLIESLTVVENPDTGRLQLAIRRGGEHTFEALILARYQMNTQVYLHKIRRIYDHYLEEYLRLWAAEHYRGPDDVLRYDDNDLLAQIRQDAAGENERSPWARRIANRVHHRVVYETGDSADLADLQEAKRLYRELTSRFGAIDFYLDDSPVSIHRLAIPGDQEEQKVEDLYIVEKNGRPKLLTHDSAIISKIPRRVRTVRIFADADGGELERVRETVRQLERTS
jgi:HD superfamily phosphohydrolase